ncbi:hypothetical protein HNR42_001171 [Deinobacterium chartae]|uniref:Uncharacterized protein n=1 Tax=Deinobacterium chartae TaxID=521158 RepID=A0A841HYL7_9DEIO|nr:hypothetical protein [Deinobacterium chartae]MBB6097754.1 hypothetical protein [Deinobacterium chartae]
MFDFERHALDFEEILAQYRAEAEIARRLPRIALRRRVARWLHALAASLEAETVRPARTPNTYGSL